MISSRIIGSCRLSTFTSFVRASPRHCPSSLARCVSSSSTAHNEAMPLPTPEGQHKVYPANIENLVTEISRLTLLEVADLNSALKSRLNIPDAAPMAMPGMMMAAPAKEEEEEEQSAVKEVKTSFAVKLTGFDAAKKVAVIKYIKSCMDGYNLVQAKKFIEDLPVLVKSDLGQDEAEKLKEELKAAGAEAVVE